MNENEKNEAAAVQETGTKPEPAQEQQPEKTFTQSELDAAIAKERQSLPSADELKAFNDWKESQKTKQEKTAEKIKLAQEAQTAAEQKASALEAKLTAVSKGVKPEAVEDVIALAKNKVSDDVTLEQAIESVIEKYPQFGSADKPLTTGVTTPNNRTPADDTLLRKAMGLPTGNEKKGN
ncbi:MAG: hypothetical protein HDT47_06365 [Ruminococcaceae bacterium]|nr:hypothetical protein [Oscillospiraceae bacterium]